MSLSRRNFIHATTAAASMALADAARPDARDESRKIRLGLIGAGGRGLQHLREGLWANEDFEVVAVADVHARHQQGGELFGWLANAQIRIFNSRPTQEQHQKLKKHTRPTSYSDHRAMLDRETLDVVLIATPPQTHYSIVMDCLAKRKHVFVEPPLASTIEDARAIVQKARETGLVVQVGHQNRYGPNHNLAYRRYREDAMLGRLTGAGIEYHFNRPGRRDASETLTEEELERIGTDTEHHTNWRLYIQPGGAPFLDVLVRDIETVNWFCAAPPTRVTVSGGVDY